MEGDKVGAEGSSAKKKVGIQDFTIKHRLGKGAYGDVFLVLKNSDHKPYALKQIQKRKLEREQKEYQAMVERELLTNFKHPGIVKLRYGFQDKSSLYFVQQYCQGGQFINFIKSNLTKLSQQVKVFYIAQIVNLLEYLHANGVTHRDLKPENLMLDKRGHLKLIDFGTAEITNCTLLKQEFKDHIIKLKQKSDQHKEENRVEEEPDAPTEMDSPLKKRRSTFVGTCYYIAPELLQHNYCPAPADLWALGCIIYQMYYLETPFKDSYEFAVFQKIKKAEYSFPKCDTITEEAIDLIKRLLVKKPEQRLGSGVTEQLSYGRLKSHPFFQSIDIDNIFNLPVPYIPDLHAVERSQQQKKEYQQSYDTFVGQTEGLLKQLSDDGRQADRWQIMQQKTFIIENYVLLVLTKTKELIIITSDEIDKKRIIQLKKNGEKCKLISEGRLLLFEEDRETELKSNKSQEWIAIIQAL